MSEVKLPFRHSFKAAIIVALVPLPDPRLELERALCRCGNSPYIFDAGGVARCLAHVGSLDGQS